MSYDFAFKAPETAKKLGLQLRISKANELFVDIDSRAAAKTFEKNVRLLGDLIVDYTRTPSRTPGHEHIVVTISRDAHVHERLLLALLLGGDPKHVMCSYQYALKKAITPVVFFEEVDA